MNSSYAYSPSILPSIITVAFLLILSIYSWRRRSEPGALPFSFAALFAALWAAGSMMEFAALNAAVKVFWIKFQACLQLPYATSVTFFFLEYTWPGRWASRRNVVLMSIFPLLAFGLILTDDLHHLLWRSFPFEGSFGLNFSITPQIAPLGWLLIAYGYMLGIINIIAAIWLFVHSPQHRLPVAILLAGLVAGRAVYLLEKTNIFQYDLPLDVLGIAFAYLMYAIALFGFRLFDPIPLACQTIISQMREGLLVLDQEGRVVSLNPAAQQILRLPTKLAVGKPMHELLAAFPEVHLDDMEETEIEYSLDVADKTGYYALKISRLNDWRGLIVGRLLVLRDVTEQKLARAQIIEQQRALASLKEREQVARELHDELSQELALINVQAQIVSSLLETGEADKAQAQLHTLAKVAREIQVDVRGQISELSFNIDLDEDFLGSLRRFLELFQQMYGIETELELPGGQSAVSLAPIVEVQLLRIVQEAFTNIRKHAMAKNVHVLLASGPEGLELVIEDDGVGFDSQSIPPLKRTFGLGIMSERAKEINARLEVKSAMGKGTRIVVVAPLCN